ncbi:hypothetical protein DFH09DRAFT_1427593 [Mycena vulgaris]|nr:hypothetical protein DFH09DRAFT_1427593 [Mycena vulgaris]
MDDEDQPGRRQEGVGLVTVLTSTSAGSTFPFVASTPTIHAHPKALPSPGVRYAIPFPTHRGSNTLDLASLLTSNRAPTAQEALQIHGMLDTGPSHLAEESERLGITVELRRSLNGVITLDGYGTDDLTTAPMVFGQVSSRWRVISRGTPRRWDAVQLLKTAFTDRGELVRQILASSRDLPLSVTLDSSHEPPTPAPDGRWFDAIWDLHRDLRKSVLISSSADAVSETFPQTTAPPFSPSWSSHPLTPLESFADAPELPSLYFCIDDSGEWILQIAFLWSQLLMLVVNLPANLAPTFSSSVPPSRRPRYTSSSRPGTPPVRHRLSARCPASAASPFPRPVRRRGNRALRAGAPAHGVALACDARAHGADARFRVYAEDDECYETGALWNLLVLRNAAHHTVHTLLGTTSAWKWLPRAVGRHQPPDPADDLRGVELQLIVERDPAQFQEFCDSGYRQPLHVAALRKLTLRPQLTIGLVFTVAGVLQVLPMVCSERYGIVVCLGEPVLNVPPRRYREEHRELADGLAGC